MSHEPESVCGPPRHHFDPYKGLRPPRGESETVDLVVSIEFDPEKGVYRGNSGIDTKGDQPIENDIWLELIRMGRQGFVTDDLTLLAIGGEMTINSDGDAVGSMRVVTALFGDRLKETPIPPDHLIVLSMIHEPKVTEYLWEAAEDLHR